uniref:MICOS complex subunit MIC13 n=1 Tax=Trichogramma kaykai TaxID=54128 RepID=A0ABD2XFX5_9HYME
MALRPFLTRHSWVWSKKLPKLLVNNGSSRSSINNNNNNNNNSSSKFVHSCGRTINLAEPRSCARPRRVQKLVSADLPLTCPHEEGVRRVCEPIRVVPVRVCRRSDLERACAPKFCDCPQKPPPKTTYQMICGWTVFGTKGAIVVGLCYWTMSEGIWGDSAATEDFYFRVRETIANDPSLDEFSVPSLAYMRFKILDSYNRAVMAIMGVLHPKEFVYAVTHEILQFEDWFWRSWKKGNILL